MKDLALQPSLGRAVAPDNGSEPTCALACGAPAILLDVALCALPIRSETPRQR